ncbi:MAG: IS1634 family transposase [Saprospiraceae bacterium]|nr:IS1634 family transposase [Saprospiraceae bacterium]
MFFKGSVRYNPSSGKQESYYRLVESYRDYNGVVRHRTMASAGFIDHLSAEELIYISKRVTEKAAGKQTLFVDEMESKLSPYIEELYAKLLKNKKVDDPTKPVKKKIEVESVKNKEVRELGSEHLALQACKQLGLPEFLSTMGWSEEKIQLTMVQLVSRTVYPASELKTSLWIKENSSICELTGYPVEKITKDKLYKQAQELYKIKHQLEQHLSQKTNELFDIQDKIYLYDLTNTYFEGEKRNSLMAQRGRSKEKRTDAKLIVLGLVVNVEGFIKYSNIFEGNMSDCKTLSDMIEHLHKSVYKNQETKPVVVIDAGIGTEENLQIINSKGFDYLCVRRSKLQEYTLKKDGEIIVYDKKDNQICLCQVEQREQEYLLKIKSNSKELKERSMHQAFTKRFEEGIENIRVSLGKKHGVKKESKVHERIGRLKEKYPSVSRFYDIELTVDSLGHVTELKCCMNEEKWRIKEQGLGVYFLRTSVKNQEEKWIWDAYNCIREIENTFRTLKTELDLRPIYHKTDQATMAHLHLGLLAYWIVNTIRYQLKIKGITHNWTEILRITSTQKLVTTSGKNDDETVEIRKASEPEPKIREIYQALKYSFYSTVKIKSVVPQTDSKKNKNIDNQEITDT